MNSTLVKCPFQVVPISRNEAELSALVDKLRDEVGQLRREVAGLRQEAGYWKGMLSQAKRKNEKLLRRVGAT